jgi:IclR family acetate operon transcriptional repressor
MSEEISSNALERGFTILETIAESSSGLTNSEISRKLEIPKSTASYLLRTMEKRGYLRKDETTGKFRLGFRLLRLTHGILDNVDVREVAKPVMQEFVKRTQMASHLAVLDNGRAVYVEKIEAESFVRMDIWVGHRLPVHTTAVGKALVAYLPTEEVIRILEERGMEKRTLQTISTHTRFLRELEKVRTYGFALDNEENSEGVRCVASPIFNMQGKVIAAIGTSNLSFHLEDSKLPEIVEILKKSAAEISMQLGYLPPSNG